MKKIALIALGIVLLGGIGFALVKGKIAGGVGGVEFADGFFVQAGLAQVVAEVGENVGVAPAAVGAEKMLQTLIV